jgi:hypothetical protein
MKARMAYVEEKEFVFRLELRAEFPEDYEGEADGGSWAEDFPGMAGEMLHAIVAVVGRHPGWSLHPRNRGRSSSDEVTLVLEKRV